MNDFAILEDDAPDRVPGAIGAHDPGADHPGLVERDRRRGQSMSDEALLLRVTELGQRFQGVDLTCRRGRAKPWVARNMCSKNERAAYRIACEGQTAEEALRALLDA